MKFKPLFIVILFIVVLTVGASAEDPHAVRLEGQPNFRDVGGYATRDGKNVKRGLVFRSGELPRLTDEDVSKLSQIGVKTVVNFLTENESKTRGKDRLPSGAREIRLPIETEGGLAAAANEAIQTGDFSKLPPSLNPEIHRILVTDANAQYAALLKTISQTNAPLVFHCSHGVHRTGSAAAILLWGLGVPWETVRKDYLLSNEYRKDEIEQRLTQLRDLAALSRNIPVDQVDMTNVRAFYILKGENIDATRDEIVAKYGTIDGYLTDGLGLTSDEIRRLRNRLLE